MNDPGAGLRERMRANAAVIQADPGRVRGADVIETVASA